MDNMTERPLERPLIDIAREMLDSRDAHLDAEKRREDALTQGRPSNLRNYADAENVRRGYEARCAEQADEDVDTLAFANTRIAALKADNAILSARLAALAGEHAAHLSARSDPLFGVVVDDAMGERFCRQFFKSDKTRNDARAALTAALTSAQTVPLASAEPVGVCSPTGSLFSTDTIGNPGYSDCYLMYRSATPQEVSRGE